MFDTISELEIQKLLGLTEAEPARFKNKIMSMDLALLTIRCLFLGFLIAKRMWFWVNADFIRGTRR